MDLPIITISRQFGSGGREIGQKLAAELGIPCYDKELINMAAKDSGLSADFIKKTEQMKATSFLYGLYMGAQSLPMNDQVFLIQSRIIKEIAEKGPCVVVGRCADYVLRDFPRVMNVFVHAPMEYRVARARDDYGKEAHNMEDMVRKRDKQRANFYNYFTQKKWGYAENYHMSVSGQYGLDYAVQILKAAALSFPGGATEA